MPEINVKAGNDFHKYTEQEILNQSQDQTFQVLVTEPLTYDPIANSLSRAYPSNPLNLKPYDYASRTVDSATVTWTFKSGGSGGTTTDTVVIVYTGTDLETISTITKT